MSSSSFRDPLRTTLSMLFPAELDASPWRRFLLLSGEAALVTLVSTYLAKTLSLDHGGLIAVFLISAALSDRLTLILEENRVGIYDHGVTSLQANRRAAGSLLALFVGILGGFVIVAVLLPLGSRVALFGLMAGGAELEGSTIFSRTFEDLGGMLLHNGVVLVAILVLSFIYRSVGGMLALTWNACAWTFVLTVLTEQTVDRVAGHSLALAAWVAAAVLPHLVLEGLGYVVAALAAIFFAKALTNPDHRASRVRGAVRAVLTLLVVAVLILVLAAMVEALWAPAMIARIPR